MLTYIEQLFRLFKIVQLSPLIDERMRKNEEKHEEKIWPLDSNPGQPKLHFWVALTPFRGGRNSILTWL